MTPTVNHKLLRDAKAGYYVPKTLGKLKSLLYGTKGKVSHKLIFGDVLVLDISFYQLTADFNKMKQEGVSGVIIRAGQNLWEDSKAQTFMTNAKAAGMPFGTYWYFDSRVSPQAQAKKWTEVLEGHNPELFCWADYEENYGGSYGGWNQLYNFLEACKSEMPNRKFGIYTGFYYWVDNSPNPITQAGNLNYFKQYPLWMAWYTLNPSIVRIPKPWDKLLLWQYSASGDGRKYGVGSLEVDMNSFEGTKEEFNITFGLDGNDNGNGGGNDMEIDWTGTVKDEVTVGLRVRATPNGLDTGKRIFARQEIKGIGQLVSAGGWNWMEIVAPESGWVASEYLNYEPVQEEPSEPVGFPDVLYVASQEDMSDKTKYVKSEE